MLPRPIPIAVKHRVKKELDDMEQKIICKVDKPTEWVSVRSCRDERRMKFAFA